jgi:hypothetical protein
MLKKFLFAVAVLCLAWLAFAQTTQTGNIVGRVFSPEGEQLPGVTVTITSPAMIIPSRSFVTAENGAFRFASLAPGDYQMTLELPGMKTVIRKGVKVAVGQTVTIDITMEMVTIEESVTVIGQTPTVDKLRTTRPANIDKIFLQSLPAPRNLNTYVNMAPGIDSLSAHGGSTMDNAVLLDGVNLIDAATGVQAAGVNFGLDIMEEIAMQASGLTAEYGSVRGAVINVVTKSGGNKFSGSASFYLNHEKLKGDNTKGTPLEGSKGGNKIEYEPIITLGGPIIKDKLWFFMNGSFNRSERFVAGYPENCTPGDEKPIKTFVPYPFFKLSFQPGENDKFTLSYNFSTTVNDDSGASKFASESVTQERRAPGHVVNFQYTKFFSSNFFANLKFGMVLYKLLLNGKGSEAQLVQNNTGISSGNSWRNHDLYTRNRFQFNADATMFIDNLAGTHELKFGGELQYAHTTWDIYGVNDPVTNGCYNLKIGDAYYYTLILKNNGFKRIDNMLDYAGFVQDAWSITRNLNLSLGFRVEYNSIIYPAQNTEEGPIEFLGRTYNRSIPESLTMYSWMNLAPRVGLIYDLFSDGKTLFKASWSRYIIPNQIGFVNLSHPNGWFGYFQYLNPDGSAIPGKIALWAMPGGFQNGGAQVGYKDHELKAGYTDELTIGVEKELFPEFSIGARYIRKWDRNQPNMVDAAQLDIDKLLSTGELDWSKNWTSKTVVDPYNNQTLTFYERINLTATEIYIINPPGLNRDYDGFELTLNKRYSRGWALNISYVYAKSRGLLTTTRADESLGGAVAGFYQSPNAHINALGALPLERRHQFKVEGLVKGPFGINLSGYFRYLSGQPVTRTVSNNYLGLSLKQNVTIYAEKRGSTFEPHVVQLDLRLEKTFRLEPITFGIFADCFNVFNRGAATAMWMNSSNQTTYEYKEMTAINNPRIFQLGARIEF